MKVNSDERGINKMEIKGITKECEDKLVCGLKRLLEMPDKKCEKCGKAILGGVTSDGICFYQEHNCGGEDN